MARTLRSLGVEFDEIDVDADARLKTRYGSDVPVLVDAHERELQRTEKLVETLMGRRPELRFDYIQKNARFARDLDL